MLDTDIVTMTGVNWNDLASVSAAADTLLTTLDADRTLLRHLTDSALADPNLLRLCEHYDILDKLVLHDDPTGWRLRLHVFLPGYFDRPHNHRWTYASRILHGSYTHTLYGTDDHIGDHVDPATLVPRMVRTELAGDTYVLHHSAIHSVVAQPHTVSLVVRGPAVKDRFLVSDRHTGQAWWQYGAAVEDPAQTATKRMTAEQVASRVQALHEQQLFAPTWPTS